MEFFTRSEEGKGIIEVSQNLDRTESGQALIEACDSILKCGQKAVIVDLKGASVINAFGVGRLCECYQKVQAVGGTLVLRNTPELMREVFEQTKLEALFKTED